MYMVTGAAGFIGSNIIAALNARGQKNIIAVDVLGSDEKFANLADLQIADYYDAAELRRAIRKGRFNADLTAISHQGACADTMEPDGRYMLDNNFTFSRELLDLAIDRRCPFVYASSGAVYGNGEAFEETPAHERPLNVYGYSKLLFDQHVRHGRGDAGIALVGLRYFNVYGPRERHKGRMASMVYQLYQQLRQHGVAKLFEGTGGYEGGEQRRDFVYVGDVVAVNLHFMAQARPLRAIVNVGAGRSRSFNDVAHGLIEAIGSGRIEYIPFPESLAGKYQSFTEAKLEGLRAAGYDAAMTELSQGIRASVAAWQAEG